MIAFVAGAVVGALIGIWAAPTVYEMHAAYWLSKHDEGGDE